MLEVGLIGLGAEWEHRYRPALLSLRHRMRVKAVHVAVASAADQLAADWRCDAVYGLRALMERADVRALLILDTAWYDGVPAEFACRAGKPAFLAGRLSDWHVAGGALASLSAECDATLMPDFGHRYMPATSRLKELLATKLGRPREILVEVGTSPGSGADALDADEADSPHEPLARALDWCSHLIGTAPVEVRSRESDRAVEVVVSYRRPASGEESAVARVSLRPDLPAAMFWNAEVRCAKGTARPTGPAEIFWEAGGEGRSESLAGERAEVEVMLDHFSRRVVGGLIPVPTLDDLCRTFHLAQAAERSRIERKPVPVEPSEPHLS